MANKKIIAGIFCGALLAVSAKFLITKPSTQELPTSQNTEQTQQKQKLEETKPSAQKPVKSVNPHKAKKADLYNSTIYDLPLSSIVEISKLPAEAKKSIDEIIESAQGLYLLKFNKEKNKVFAILQNPINNETTYQRHNIEFVEIALNGEKTFYSAGYNGTSGETVNKNDVWTYEKETELKQPVKHTSFDEDGEIKFTEIWNYDDKPIKYEMKDENNKVVSIIKETTQGDTDYRKEHVFYDENGNTKMSISASYEGANLKRFSYYNAETPEESVVIVNEYSDTGAKQKEYIYNGNYELINQVKTNYVDGERKSIQVLDKDGNELDEISG